MAIEVVLPNLGIAVEKGTIIEWMKNEGDFVRRGEILFVVEVEKVTTEVESPASGILAKILVSKGIQVPILTVVGIIIEPGEELSKEYMMQTEGIEMGLKEGSAETVLNYAGPTFKGEKERRSPDIRIVPAARRLARENELDLQDLVGTGPEGVILMRDIEEAVKSQIPSQKASPVASAMARAHNIDMSRVMGSGPRGRIVKADIQGIVRGKGVLQREEPEKRASIVQTKSVRKETAEIIPIRGVRRAIFDNMFQSLSQSAQLTIHTEASGEPLVRLRNALSKDEKKFSYNAILIKIVASALRRHPKINASVEGNEIHVWKQIHIGLAIEVNDALIVPVLRSPDLKSIRQIEEEAAELIRKAKENKMSPDDLVYGTFTITNLGFADVDFFTPIIRPPESAILGIGRIIDKPVIKNGNIISEARIGLSLTFDHRIIDGAPAARFLKTIKDLVEEPALMIEDGYGNERE